MKKVYKYSEKELVAGCKQHSKVHQKALYQQYYRLMFGVCLRYTDNRDDAEDVLQEGFIKVFQHLKNFRGQGSLEGWIRRIMVHTSIEHYRKRSRYFMVDIEHARDVELSADQLGHLTREELLVLIRALPAGYRTVFNLYVIEGYSHKEIAKMLKISEGTSKSQLSRAKGLLKTQVSQRKAASQKPEISHTEGTSIYLRKRKSICANSPRVG